MDPVKIKECFLCLCLKVAGQLRFWIEEISGEAVVISLDAQCVFDQVEWPYMMSVLNKFGFGPSFMKWIDIIYSQPTASVITYQNISQPIKVATSTPFCL